MYIGQKLIKAVNEEYFRNYSDVPEFNGMFPIKNVENDNTNQVYLIILEQDFKDNEFKRMVEDLVNLNQPKYNFVSELAIKAQQILDGNSKDIKERTISLSATTKQVMRILETHSKESYIVGGFVRDALRFVDKDEIKDVDFVTDTPINILSEDFEALGFKVQSEGKQFLVCIVSRDGEQFEIANLRRDKDNLGGEVGTIYDDAQRRDFTVNALYFNVSTGKIKDPNGTGLDDLENNLLRFVGKAKERIIEDPNRVGRFYRFVDKGFKPDNKSLKAVRENFDYFIKKTSPERIRLELERIVGLV